MAIIDSNTYSHCHLLMRLYCFQCGVITGKMARSTHTHKPSFRHMLSFPSKYIRVEKASRVGVS